MSYLRDRSIRARHHARNLGRLLTNADGRRGPIGRGYAFDAILKVAPAVVAQAGDLRFLVDTADKGVGRVTFAEGAYELQVMEDALRIVSEQVGRDPLRGRVFVDVGANVGTSSIPAVIKFGAASVLSVEPAPSNFKLLRCNTILNDVEDRVRCRQFAVTTESGTVTMELSNSNSGDNRVAAVTTGENAYGETSWDRIEVPAEPLDAILEGESIEPADVGLLWVDTQGHEGHVLASAKRLLGAHVPAIIEYWPYGLERANGLDLLHSVIAEHFTTVIDVRSGERMPAGAVSQLRDRYTERTYTDLALIP